MGASAEPLSLRHGKIGLVFELYPQIHQSLYTLPISFPQEGRQMLYVETTTPYYTKEELQDVDENGRPKAQVLPFTGGPFVHPRDIWGLVKSLREFINGERDKIYISPYFLAYYGDIKLRNDHGNVLLLRNVNTSEEVKNQEEPPKGILSRIFQSFLRFFSKE